MILSLPPYARDLLDEAALRALACWGDKHQSIACAEELCELASKLLRFANHKDRDGLGDEIREEIVDCYIVLQQASRIFFSSRSDFLEVLERKVSKLSAHIEEQEA